MLVTLVLCCKTPGTIACRMGVARRVGLTQFTWRQLKKCQRILACLIWVTLTIQTIQKPVKYWSIKGTKICRKSFKMLSWLFGINRTSNNRSSSSLKILKWIPLLVPLQNRVWLPKRPWCVLNRKMMSILTWTHRMLIRLMIMMGRINRRVRNQWRIRRRKLWN